MNKISFYIFLILVFLGISKAFEEKSQVYINSEEELPKLPKDKKWILINSFQKGFIIKTYFQTYDKVEVDHESRFQDRPEERITARTSLQFWDKKNKDLSKLLNKGPKKRLCLNDHFKKFFYLPWDETRSENK